MRVEYTVIGHLPPVSRYPPEITIVDIDPVSYVYRPLKEYYLSYKTAMRMKLAESSHQLTISHN